MTARIYAFSKLPTHEGLRWRHDIVPPAIPPTRDTQSDQVEPIISKYFNPRNYPTVKAVSNNILGGDPSQGNVRLSDMTAHPDHPDPSNDGKLTCNTKDNFMAQLRDQPDLEHPIIILCDSAFTHGGIGKGYGSIPLFNVPAVACGNFDERVSWKMDTLGSTLLREYTHWARLVAPPLLTGTKDYGYGAWKCQGLNRVEAARNADSYSWVATEVLWTTICNKKYQLAIQKDDRDPGCGGLSCFR
nr:hypothetical protein B0A51_04654 [Rachicladosporium sp. CCFEE 5018]